MCVIFDLHLVKWGLIFSVHQEPPGAKRCYTKSLRVMADNPRSFHAAWKFASSSSDKSVHKIQWEMSLSIAVTLWPRNCSRVLARCKRSPAVPLLFTWRANRHSMPANPRGNHKKPSFFQLQSMCLGTATFVGCSCVKNLAISRYFNAVVKHGDGHTRYIPLYSTISL